MTIPCLNNDINQNKAILEGLNNLADQGIFTTDTELNICSWNHWLEVHSGLSSQDVIGRNLLAVYSELSQRRLDRFYYQALKGQVVVLAQRLHGYLLPMLPSISTSKSSRMQQSVRIGTLRVGYRNIGTITVIDDVTERVEREAELQNYQEHLEELVARRTSELTQTLEKLQKEIADRQRTEERLRQSEARFRELAQRETLLNRLASQIRCSLDLNRILHTAVHEIRNLLQIDRCFFLWYRPHTEPAAWEVVAESKASILPSLIGYSIPVTTFEPLTTRVLNKEITRVDSVRTLTAPVEQQFFLSIGYTAVLALPIHTTYGAIGVVSCGHSCDPRPWRDEEVELLHAVADQLAIAIDQAQLLHESRTATIEAQEQTVKLQKALGELKQAQAQLVQSEKMSSLGQLVAGVAHEINNPVSFIYGNLTYVNQHFEDLLNLVQRYQECYPQPAAAVQDLAEKIDLDFIREDLPKILKSMQMGTERISQIVLSLRNFSRLDEAEKKWVDIHEGLDNTLLMLGHRLKAKQPNYPDIQVIKDYGNLPRVQCYPGQLNQVFMNILSNAIEALDEHNKECLPSDLNKYPRTIWICTDVLANCNQVVILIGDNGPGMTPEVCERLFEPFFTTKPVGQGTGLGMSISYQIVVEKHRGKVQCISAPGYGTAFLIYVPMTQP